MKKTRWEYVGGNQYSLIQESEDGYNDTICSIEIDNSYYVEVVYMTRPLDKIELKSLLNLIITTVN
jgi:hypothetical protein